MRRPMRRTIAATAAFILTGALVAASPALARQQGAKGPQTVNTTKLTKAVTVNGILQHERALQGIANDNDGTRASGPGLRRLGRLRGQRLRKAGYKVHARSSTFPFFRNIAPGTLSTAHPRREELRDRHLRLLGTGDVTGVVVAGERQRHPRLRPGTTSDSGCCRRLRAGPRRPAVALIQRGACDFSVKVDNAKPAGYDAVIIFNEGNPGRTDLSVGTLARRRTSRWWG